MALLGSGFSPPSLGSPSSCKDKRPGQDPGEVPSFVGAVFSSSEWRWLMVSGWLVSERTDEQVLLLCNSSLNVRPRGPAFPHCVLPLPTNIREVPSRTSRSRHEDPGTGHQAAAWVGKDGVCSGAAEQAWLRAAQGPLHPEPEHLFCRQSPSWSSG